MSHMTHSHVTTPRVPVKGELIITQVRLNISFLSTITVEVKV